MLLLLPLVGGVLAGWLAPARTAIAIQVVFAVIGATVVIASAPHHGASHAVAVWVIPLTLVIAVGALLAGMRLRRRRTPA